MILYRPVGLQELALIYDSGMKTFPARLPQQPIFYPVLQLEYARQTAAGWNAKNGQLAGYVTEFKVEDEYVDKFEEHMVGKSQDQELWIPAEEMEEFNRHILGHIRVLEAHFGNAFEGFIPDQYGLQGKNAVEQFTLLANSYLYKRMDFYLELKRNHKAVFLNYLFWQTYEFKNPGLKEKILKAIKEAWLTSFPKIPLPSPLPIQENTPSVRQTDSYILVDPVEEAITPGEQTDSEEQNWVDPLDEEITPVEQTASQAPVDTLREEIAPEPQTYANTLLHPVIEDVKPIEQSDSHAWGKPVHKETTLPRQTDSGVVQGIRLGLSGDYHGAIAELSQAVLEDAGDIVAHTSLGVAFHRLGETDRALACYETALKIDPNYAEAHYFRANILYAQGNIREAIAGYTVALGLMPELVEAHQKPIPQDRLTDYTASPAEMHRIARPAYRILELSKSIERDARQANLLKERAAAYSKLWNYEQAITDYDAALALQPEDAGALHARGVAYEQLGQRDRALEDYQRAIALNAQLSDAYLQRGITFGTMGNLRQSIASFTEGIRLAPQNPDGYFNRGTAYFQQGDLEKAIADFSQVIQLSPKDEAAYYWRGISQEEAGRQREAIADYRQFLGLSQDPHARQEIEQRLSQWNVSPRDRAGSPDLVPGDRQKTNQPPLQKLDIHGLLAALGERAANSIWFGSGVECYGEKAQELYAYTEQERPIEGRELLSIASAIRQTVQGDFQAFDPGANSPWIFIRAWEGNGFYVETNDPKVTQQLKTQLRSVEDVAGAAPPYQGLFIRI